jgi:hypothetical protein
MNKAKVAQLNMTKYFQLSLSLPPNAYLYAVPSSSNIYSCHHENTFSQETMNY